MQQRPTVFAQTSMPLEAILLTGVGGETLSVWLQAVSVVRNALAHNRAISEESLTILRGDLTVINAAIDRFRHNTLYAKVEVASLSQVPADLHQLVHLFDDLVATCAGQQLFLGASKHFVSVVRLPVVPFNLWLNSKSSERRSASQAT